MKGIQLAIDSTIILIIAIAVLAMALVILFSSSEPALSQSQWQQNRARMCSDFAQQYRNCDIEDPDADPLASNIITLCKTYSSYSDCEGETTESKIKCLRRCCIGYCP